MKCVRPGSTQSTHGRPTTMAKDSLTSDERCIVSGLPESRCIHCLYPKLEAVAEAAKNLVESAEGSNLGLCQAYVNDPKLTALESALEAAGYGMTEQELEEAL